MYVDTCRESASLFKVQEQVTATWLEESKSQHVHIYQHVCPHTRKCNGDMLQTDVSSRVQTLFQGTCRCKTSMSYFLGLCSFLSFFPVWLVFLSLLHVIATLAPSVWFVRHEASCCNNADSFLSFQEEIVVGFVTFCISKVAALFYCDFHMTFNMVRFGREYAHETSNSVNNSHAPSFDII